MKKALKKRRKQCAEELHAFENISVWIQMKNPAMSAQVKKEKFEN